MGFIGDFAKLRKLKGAFSDMAGARMRAVLSQRIGATAVKLIADEFKQSRDPYGKPWAPVTRVDRRSRRARKSRTKKYGVALGDKPLVNTGRMKNSVNAQPLAGGNGIRILIPVVYANVHNYGYKHIKRRQMVPGKGGGLGPIWRAAMEDETRRTVNDILKGAR